MRIFINSVMQNTNLILNLFNADLEVGKEE